MRLLIEEKKSELITGIVERQWVTEGVNKTS